MSNGTADDQTGWLLFANRAYRRRLLWATMTTLSVWSLASSLAAEPCPVDHQCYELPHGRLAIPSAYARPLMPGGERLGNFHPNKAWFSFWMPDGAPAGGVKAGSVPFYMYPDAFEPSVKNQPPVPRNPPVSNPRTIVNVSFCLLKGIKDGDCFSPDRGMDNMVGLRAYEVEHHNQSAVVIDPARPAGLLSGTTSTIENVDDIYRFGLIHQYFGRTGCDGQSCMGHFSFRCDLHVPFPPYQICHGDYEMKQIGFTAYVMFIGFDDLQTLAMAETATRLVRSWTTLNSSGG